MKVLHVIPSVGPLHGGPSFVLRTMTEALAAKGVSVSVATTDDNSGGRLNVRLDAPSLENGVIYRYFWRQTRFYTVSWPLYRWLSSHVADYDLVHIHAIFSFASTAAASVAARRGVPYVICPHGTLNSWGIANRRPNLKQLSLGCIERPILTRAACVQFTSEQERLEAQAVAPKVTGRVIPNSMNRASHGTTASQEMTLRFPELIGKRIVLFLSRLDRKKGLDLLLKAFARVIDQLSDVALVIAGNGEPEFIVELKDSAASLGIENSIVWAGFLEAEAKDAALASANVFVLPSYSENFGIAVIEAMAAGLPVIVSDQVGIHTEIRENSAGVVVSCDAYEVAGAVIRLLMNPVDGKAMAERGRHFAEREYSREAVTDKLLHMYQQILN